MLTKEYTVKEKMLNEKEAAKYIGMSVSYLKKKRYEGVLEHKPNGPTYFKIGRSVRYTYDDLDSWLKNKRILGSDDE